MTNTLARLEWAGHVHIRPDWDDARRKFVAISPSGRSARDAAVQAVAPMIAELVRDLGAERVRAVLPVLRELRTRLEIGGARPGATVVLDPVPGGPMRSWIGPVTLAHALAALCRMAVLPPVLNLAQPGPLRMAALLESAGIDWRYGLPNPATARRATLDTGRASALLGPVLATACAPSLIAEWRGLAA
jgi:hypothetical protein